jgi:SAM-dependent methyltransferase
LLNYLRYLHDDGMDVNASRRRWDEMLRSLAGLLPPGPASVLVGGRGEQAAVLAARLAAALEGRARVCSDGGDGGAPWDVVIWARTAVPAGHGDEDKADIVIDMHDPDWPVIRRVAAPLAARGPWYLTETRAFFGCRAATWDAKFGDDLPAYAAAIAQAGIAAGGVVIDLGCGTGRALPSLRQAVGPDGSVIAVDVTPEMLSQARPASRRARAALVLADARRLPFATASADAIFAAGLINHLPDAEAGFRELARVTRPGGLLVLFHPAGRAALAARHGRALSADEPLAAGPLRRSTQATGWRLTAYDDAASRFFAVAVRQQSGLGGLSPRGGGQAAASATRGPPSWRSNRWESRSRTR